MNYVTYDADGNLTGAYCQDVHSSHTENHIEVTPEQRREWTKYRATADRSGVELAPAPVVDLGAAKAAAIAKTYKDVDAVIYDAIGNRQDEYAKSEAAALAYQAAGFTGEVSEFVSGYAQSNPTDQVQTNQWAAEYIIAQANGMRAAQLAMRNMRFDHQKLMRAATTAAELNTAISQWNGFIAATRTGLGLSN